MSKTDDQLRSEIDTSETRGEWGAWAVVAGLVLEIAIALMISFSVDNKWVDNWGAVLADCLIALGVYAEIHFGRRAAHGDAELRRRSEEKVAAANERAATAELQTEKLRKELAWRRVSADEAKKISEFLSTMPKLCLRIIYPANDPEAVGFSHDIANVFRANGWRVLFMSTVSASLQFSGMMIPLYPPPNLDACGIVRAAISSAGIEFVGGAPPPASGMMMASGDNVDGPTADINIGSKPPPQLD